MRPFIIRWVAGAHLAAPVERESYLVQLLAVALDVLFRRDGRMLSCLYGILLGRQSVGIVAHGVQHVEALLPLVAGVDVAGDVAQRMAHMQTRPAGIGEHVEHIEFLLVLIFGHSIELLLVPPLMPFLFNLSEVVFHIDISVFVCKGTIK